jgi:hypothetical protein
MTKVYVCWVAEDCMEYKGELHRVNVTLKTNQPEADEWIEQTKKLKEHINNIAYSFGGKDAYTKKMIEKFGEERYKTNYGKGEYGDKEMWNYHKQLYREDDELRLSTLRQNGYERVAEALKGEHSAVWLSYCGYDELELEI